MGRNDDVAVPMRDGVLLLADVHRPAEPGRYPVLVAASPYPLQIQNLGAPPGFIEAGASDFFVPRGYVHVIRQVTSCGCISLPTTRTQTSQPCWNLNTPAWVPVPSTPFFPHRGCFCLYCGKGATARMESAATKEDR